MKALFRISVVISGFLLILDSCKNMPLISVLQNSNGRYWKQHSESEFCFSIWSFIGLNEGTLDIFLITPGTTFSHFTYGGNNSLHPQLPQYMTRRVAHGMVHTYHLPPLGLAQIVPSPFHSKKQYSVAFGCLLGHLVGWCVERWSRLVCCLSLCRANYLITGIVLYYLKMGIIPQYHPERSETAAASLSACNIFWLWLIQVIIKMTCILKSKLQQWSKTLVQNISIVLSNGSW